MDIKVTNFSTISEEQALFDITVLTESEESINLKGNFGLTPFAIQGNTDIKAIKLTKYEPYYKEILVPDLVGGQVDFSTDFQHKTEESATRTNLSSLAVTLSDLLLSNAWWWKSHPWRVVSPRCPQRIDTRKTSGPHRRCDPLGPCRCPGRIYRSSNRQFFHYSKSSGHQSNEF